MACLIYSRCWICGETIMHDILKRYKKLSRITHVECAKFHYKKKSYNRGRMNDRVQYRTYEKGMLVYIRK